MNVGKFYFIKDSYFFDFPDENLEKNKEMIDGAGHKRPCFYGLLDSETGIFWMIPISSKTDKYLKIYKEKMIKRGFCDTIVIGNFMGKEIAFLIQNMFPVIYKYISNEYVDARTNKAFMVDRPLEEKIIRSAKTILSMARKGRKVIFPDVLKIEKELLSK